MKKSYSPAWVSSKQRRKQRKYRANAPMHKRQDMLRAHLDKALRKDFKVRSLPVRKGDEVSVMRGEFRKKTGAVLRADLKALKVYVDGVKRKKQSGQETNVAIDPSNLKITKLNMDDSRRRKFMKRKGEK